MDANNATVVMWSRPPGEPGRYEPLGSSSRIDFGSSRRLFGCAGRLAERLGDMPRRCGRSASVPGGLALTTSRYDDDTEVAMPGEVDDVRRLDREDRVEAKIDRIDERVLDLYSILSEGLGRIAVTERLTASHGDALERLNREVFEGNGHPALTSRVTGIEHTTAQVAAAVADLRRNTAAALRDMRVNTEKQRDGAVANRWQWAALVTSVAAIFVAIVTAVIEWLK